MDNEQKPTPPSKDPASPAARRPRRTLMAGALAVVVIGGLLWWHPWNRTPAAGSTAQGTAASAGGAKRGRGGPAAMANVPQPVQVATATQGEMPIVLSALGTVTPLANVTVKTQLSGYLQSVAFQEGQIVKKGDLLAQIDPRPYQVALENAEGTHARDSALLATARLDLKRYQTLLSQDSIASQTVDTQASSSSNTKAR